MSKGNIHELTSLNKSIFFPAIVFFLVLTNSCDIKNDQSAGFNLLLKTLLSESVPQITVDELHSLSADVILLDVREAEEYCVSRISGSQNVGADDFELDDLSHIGKNDPIVVYCSVGYRSEIIGEKLLEAGYQDVKNLYGGIFAWVNKHKPVVNDQGTVNRVHPYNSFWGMWIDNKTILKTSDCESLNF